MWFRPEFIQTVSWGGDPNKPVAADSGDRLRPRHSFALWREEVRLRSHPWTASNLEAADELRRRAIEVDIARRFLSEQRAVRARNDLLAVVSHDLRGPLSGVLLQTEVMLRLTRGGDEEGAGALRGSAERIRRSAAHMKALTDDLLDLASIEAHRFALHLKSVESRELVEEALLAASPLAEAKRITLAVELIDVPRLEADPERIFRVLSNLLGNAIKFTPEGGTITVRAERRGDDLVDRGRRHRPRHCRRPASPRLRALLEGPVDEPARSRARPLHRQRNRRGPRREDLGRVLCRRRQVHLHSAPRALRSSSASRRLLRCPSPVGHCLIRADVLAGALDLGSSKGTNRPPAHLGDATGTGGFRTIARWVSTRSQKRGSTDLDWSSA